MRTPSASFVLAFSLAPAGLQAQDLPEIQAKGVLRVIVDASNLPERFNVGSGGEPGLEKEILLGFASLHKLTLAVVTTERADERVAQLVSGKGDVVAGIVVTESRRRQVDFTSEVLPSRHVVVTRKPEPVLEDLAVLRSRRVGATKGSSWAEVALAAGVPRASLDDSYAAPEEMLEALRTQRVSAAVMTAVWAILARKRDPDLQIGAFVGPASTVAFAVRKESPLLLKALDAHVSNLRRTPTWSRLVVKYFGENALEILKKSRAE
jgi:ABC-type amino acid transport substrate-binding protein